MMRFWVYLPLGICLLAGCPETSEPVAPVPDNGTVTDVGPDVADAAPDTSDADTVADADVESDTDAASDADAEIADVEIADADSLSDADIDPTQIGHSAISCGSPTQELTPVDCTINGDTGAFCVFSNHCGCGPGFVCEVPYFEGGSVECAPGSVCVAAPEPDAVDSDATADSDVVGPDISVPPTNDTCATATALTSSATFTVDFALATDSTTGPCAPGVTLDVFYALILTEALDITVTISGGGDGSIFTYSVRESCDPESPQFRCDGGLAELGPVGGTLHDLPAGDYILVISASSTSSPPVDMVVTFGPATPTVTGDTCATAQAISTDGAPIAGTFMGAENDLATGCGIFRDDLTYTFTLTEAADVFVFLDAGAGAGTNFSIRTVCDDPVSALVCAAGEPATFASYNLVGGTYFLVVESASGGPFTLNVSAQSPPTIPTEVAGNGTCAGAHMIWGSGLFFGSTLLLLNDYDLDCGGSASDAAFELTLTESTHIVLSTAGSAFDTVVKVFKDVCTSGTAVACNDNSSVGLDYSALDLELPPGTYFIVVDGYSPGASGEYYLSVSLDP